MSKIILALAWVCLSGCAQVYQAQSGNEPRGYRETQVSEKEYLVTYESWRASDRDALPALATRRAAELGQEIGHDAFFIEDVQRLVREDSARAADTAASSRVAGLGSASKVDMPSPSVGMRQLVYSVTLRVRYVSGHTESATSVQTVLARPLP